MAFRGRKRMILHPILSLDGVSFSAGAIRTNP